MQCLLSCGALDPSPCHVPRGACVLLALLLQGMCGWGESETHRGPALRGCPKGGPGHLLVGGTRLLGTRQRVWKLGPPPGSAAGGGVPQGCTSKGISCVLLCPLDFLSKRPFRISSGLSRAQDTHPSCGLLPGRGSASGKWVKIRQRRCKTIRSLLRGGGGGGTHSLNPVSWHDLGRISKTLAGGRLGLLTQSFQHMSPEPRGLFSSLTVWDNLVQIKFTDRPRRPQAHQGRAFQGRALPAPHCWGLRALFSVRPSPPTPGMEREAEGRE